ncbi:MAG: 1-(5-phosphoribosyl)-5-[(5-phosphoribosylamino)methylideneamino]imidazole-4-carboxamide isomerase [Ruthenibacterium sp.]
MDIFPAIDLKDGRAVRLTQGDYSRVQVFDDDPVAVAENFARQGAQCLHLVDLDGAKDGALSNYDVIAKIVKATHLFVEIGGGIRDENRVNTYLSLGVGRVILGTAALRDPAFLKRMAAQYGAKIAVGVDAKNGFVATDGWLNVSTTDSVAFCKEVHEVGVQNIIYTDIAKDGAMQGTNLAIYRVLSKIDGIHITASGGINALSDITALREMGVAAAIVGKALYLGALTLPAVLAAAEGNKI